MVCSSQVIPHRSAPALSRGKQARPAPLGETSHCISLLVYCPGGARAVRSLGINRLVAPSWRAAARRCESLLGRPCRIDGVVDTLAAPLFPGGIAPKTLSFGGRDPSGCDCPRWLIRLMKRAVCVAGGVGGKKKGRA